MLAQRAWRWCHTNVHASHAWGGQATGFHGMKMLSHGIWITKDRKEMKMSKLEAEERTKHRGAEAVLTGL